MPATRKALIDLDIPPYFIADVIETLPAAPLHLVWRDGNLDDRN